MGAGVVLSQALNEKGIQSRVIAKKTHPFGFKANHIMNPPWNRFQWVFLKKIGYSKFNILHNHANYRLNKRIFENWKGRFIQHYHDLKTQEPLYDTPSFVSIPTLLKIIPDSIWLPLPVDTKQFNGTPQTHHGKGVVVGFCAQNIDPTKKKMIPHKELIDIANENDKISLLPLKEIIPHNQIREYYSKIDVWVDRIIEEDEGGFYGFAASECAAMGIPIISKIDESLSYIGCPFINITNRDALANELNHLAEDEAHRRILGEKARDYAHRIHDSMKVADICLKTYKELLN